MVSVEGKKQYIEWYNLAQETIDNEEIIPKISDDRIIDVVSERNWLPIPIKIEQTKEHTKNRDNCKIWISIGRAFGDPINSKKIQMGLSYNNQKGIDRFVNLLLPFNSELRKSVVEKFSKTDPRYKLIIYRKVKEFNYAQVPDYDPVLEFAVNKIKDKEINEILELVQRLSVEARQKSKEEKEKGKYFSDFPEISLEIEINRDKEEFKKLMVETVELYKILSRVEDENSIIRKLKQEIKNLEEMRPRGEAIFEEGALEKDKKLRDKIEEKNKQLEFFQKTW